MTARRYCFTLNNPLSSEHPTLENVQYSRYIVYQLEQGSQGTPHLQGYIELDRPCRLTQIKRSLPRAHFEIARGNSESNIRYCSKEPRIGETVVLGQPGGSQGKRNDIHDYVTAVRRGSTEAELLSELPGPSARYPRLRQSIILADRSRPPLRLELLRDWQQEVMTIFNSNPHPRKIVWIWDEEGGIGKTAFAKHIVATQDAFYVTGGKHADILFAYSLQKTIVFDLPRGYKDKIPYGVLESFKNGVVFSSKYESRTLFFDTPHVIVFANYPPVRSELSADRWDVRNVIVDGLNHIMTI